MIPDLEIRLLWIWWSESDMIPDLENLVLMWLSESDMIPDLENLVLMWWSESDMIPDLEIRFIWFEVKEIWSRTWKIWIWSESDMIPDLEIRLIWIWCEVKEIWSHTWLIWWRESEENWKGKCDFKSESMNSSGRADQRRNGSDKSWKGWSQGWHFYI